jgi:hypothetical protein
LTQKVRGPNRIAETSACLPAAYEGHPNTLHKADAK